MNETITNTAPEEEIQPTQPTILVVSNDINIRHWIKDNFGDNYRIQVCTNFLIFTTELKWEDTIKLILIDYQDELFDTWEIVEILDSTHPSLPAALLTQTQSQTDDIFRRAPHKKVIALYHSLEVARARISEILQKSARLAENGNAGQPETAGLSNLTDEIERLARNLEAVNNLSPIVENIARQNGFDGINTLRRFNDHLENVADEWNSLN